MAGAFERLTSHVRVTGVGVGVGKAEREKKKKNAGPGGRPREWGIKASAEDPDVSVGGVAFIAASSRTAGQLSSMCESLREGHLNTKASTLWPAAGQGEERRRERGEKTRE